MKGIRPVTTPSTVTDKTPVPVGIDQVRPYRLVTMSQPRFSQWLLNGCKRCGGALRPDLDGDYLCVQCGRTYLRRQRFEEVQAAVRLGPDSGYGRPRQYEVNFCNNGHSRSLENVRREMKDGVEREYCRPCDRVRVRQTRAAKRRREEAEAEAR